MSIGKWLMRVGGIGIALTALAGLVGIFDSRTVFNILVVGLVVAVIGQLLIYVDGKNST